MDDAPAPVATGPEASEEVRPRRRAVRRPRQEAGDSGVDANDAIGNKIETSAE
jgi:hypothetical protein